MRVILKEHIENLGKKGDVVDVAPGYGRNYLIPKNFAIEVNTTNVKMIEMQQRALKKGLNKEIESHRALVSQLDDVILTFSRKSGEKDAIFGSVSTADIREALGKLNFDIEKKKILLDEPIKKLGNYSVAIRVFHDEKAEINVAVVKEGEEEKREERKEEKAEEKLAVQGGEQDKMPPEEITKEGKPSGQKEAEQQRAAESTTPVKEEKVVSAEKKDNPPVGEKTSDSK